MEFRCSSEPTVGVEWELQLVDTKTLDLYNGILPLMEFFPETEHVKPEYIQSCVELTSCIAKTSDEAVRHISNTLARIMRRCHELEMDVCGAGTHPVCRELALITPTPRYLRLKQDAGHLAHRQITFSTHVHTGMRSGDEAIRAMSHLVPALPALIALSANSPFWRGYKTGHAAYRHRILAASPYYGLPVEFRNWACFERFIDAAQKSGMIRRVKDIHWDVRPSPDFGTVEIRTMDAAGDLQTLRALTAFARVMTVRMARSSAAEVRRVIPLDLPGWIVKENCYRASHHGLNGMFIYDESGNSRPVRGLIEELISFCQATAAEIGEGRNLALCREILINGPGYVQQLEVYARNNSARAVVKSLRNQLLESQRVEQEDCLQVKCAPPQAPESESRLLSS
jgi:carboxylate-amine ligase